jgi:hypothetical protein
MRSPLARSVTVPMRQPGWRDGFNSEPFALFWRIGPDGPAPKGEPTLRSTIYDLNGSVITDGVLSQRHGDDTIRTARIIASDRQRSVVVEDNGTREVYRITRKGRKWPAPADWTAPWERSAPRVRR